VSNVLPPLYCLEEVRALPGHGSPERSDVCQPGRGTNEPTRETAVVPVSERVIATM
jgi:hypothetical protein